MKTVIATSADEGYGGLPETGGGIGPEPIVALGLLIVLAGVALRRALRAS